MGAGGRFANDGGVPRTCTMLIHAWSVIMHQASSATNQLDKLPPTQPVSYTTGPPIPRIREYIYNVYMKKCTVTTVVHHANSQLFCPQLAAFATVL